MWRSTLFSYRPSADGWMVLGVLHVKGANTSSAAGLSFFWRWLLHSASQWVFRSHIGEASCFAVFDAPFLRIGRFLALTISKKQREEGVAAGFNVFMIRQGDAYACVRVGTGSHMSLSALPSIIGRITTNSKRHYLGRAYYFFNELQPQISTRSRANL